MAMAWEKLFEKPLDSKSEGFLCDYPFDLKEVLAKFTSKPQQ
jgi:hypothetical protein